MTSQYLASSSMPSPTIVSPTTTTSAHDYDGASFKTPVTRSIMNEPLDSGCRARTMGDVRLRNRETHEVILRPTPTSDPNDPLNWPQWFKYYLTGLTCVAIMMCNFLAAGPTIAIVETALEFLPNLPLSDAIAKVAFFFTTTALLQGIGNFIWIPLANKFGRRPVYVTSYLIYLASTVWLVYEQSYAGFLAGRILMGFGSGAADTIAPLTITDLFFLHERGAVMCAYTAFLSMGVGLGMLVSGYVFSVSAGALAQQSATHVPPADT
jgi:Na+/melibiose symporter-like transporter